jgi:hypothetical protein
MDDIGSALLGRKAGIEISGFLSFLRVDGGSAQSKNCSERSNLKFVHEVPHGRKDRWRQFGDKESVILPPGANGKAPGGVWSSCNNAEIVPRKSVFFERTRKV